MNKQFYDENAFYVEQKKWGTWDSYTPEGKCIVTSLTEENCIASTRYMLKLKQENLLNEVEVSYPSTVDGKL